ncbi:MAG TPA: PVC-type heme-binding CxxCH protein [Vicinamibacterales bacterium]|nr:PVC-type heme-binding CxxCH protein [Vicinamibacterales bacterium]
MPYCSRVDHRMKLTRIAIFGLFLALFLASGSAQQPPPSPAAAARGGTVSPPLPVDAALRTFTLPAGYRVELVASEPLVLDPVAIDWDADGRMWVVEMPGYMRDIQASGELDPLGRVVVLEDTNGDGKMDKRTVFADNLVLARAVKVLDRGVLVAEPPNLWLMRDTTGDLKADGKELVTDRYGRREANVEHNANGLFWALDNWIYTSEVDIFLRLKDGQFEVRSVPARGQWGLSQDDAGRIYRNSNPSALHVDLVPTPYYGRNPDLRRTRGSYEFLGADASLNTVWPARPTPAVNRGYQTGVLRPDGTLREFTAASVPTVYRGDRLPPDLYGNVFVADPAGNLVSRIIVEDDGRTLRARKAYERQEFLASTDERFRPVNLSAAPDGTLYVMDMYRGIIQHRAYITEYLRDQILGRNLEAPIHYGRIYRVVHESTRPGPRPSLSSATPARLVETLAHRNGWWRDTAQRLLIERADKSVVSALTAMATPAKPGAAFQPRLHALWTLEGLDALTPAVVEAALADPAREVRMSAVRLSERWLREPKHPLHPAVQKLMSDADWNVRQQVAASLGELAEGREAALAAVLEGHANDPVVADAALSGLKGRETAVLDLLLQSGAETPARSAALTLLAATMLGGREDLLAQGLFDEMANPSRPSWQRSALLRGAEVALLGAAAPGSEGERGRGAARGADPQEPCPSCPGGRAGPGGAPAFARGNSAAPPEEGGARGAAGGGRGAGRGRVSAPALTLSRAPAIASADAANGEIGSRVAAVLARVEWPGKAGVAAVTPLTAEEQARFEAGRTIYQNLCVACHQADGRGREKLANSLVGSALAVGAPGVPVRVLLHGKEGANGLMPPLGGVLSDEQVGAVLTYIRREWGNTASPIDAASVAAIRRATGDRTRPWTDQELSTMRDPR